MTQYKLSPLTTGIRSASILPIATQEAREKRKHVLAAVRQRRRVNYRQFMEKRRLQATNDLVTMV